ncbi:MAG: HAMP domain-containing histidine kinase [Clostridiales bacterium]|nr:HAMP domain-containing histidine kinase [Clostridiales bacterium]
MAYLISSISILISIIIILRCVKYTNDNYDAISSILDKVISKKDSISLPELKDNRKSKLVYQSKKIIDMVQIDREKAEHEKEVIKQLIGDISHQVKTPFANIKMYTELLAKDNLTLDEKNKYIEELKAQNEKLTWLIDSLFKTSRLESGAIEFATDVVGIKQTIADSISAIYSQAYDKNINIVVDEFEDVALWHNRKWTIEVLVNILENAIKYSHMNSQIKISINKMDIYTRINIQDNGIGIIKEDYNNIFKRFFRGKNAEEYIGVGIGLYLSSLIMSKQGGYITVKSKIDKGSIFSICLQSTKKLI